GRTAAMGAANLGDTAEDGIDEGAIGGQKRGALLGYRIELAGAFGGLGTQIPELLEQGQGRVDHTGTGAVRTAELLLDRLDQLVAVARFFGDQMQQHIAQIAVVEEAPEPPAAAAAAIMAAETLAAKAEIASHLPSVAAN